MVGSPRFNITSPLGRIVSGDPWTPSDKDNDGQLRVYKSGPKKGEPNPQYYIGLAVPKVVRDPATGQPIHNPDWANFLGFIDQVARQAWPQLFPNGGQCVAQNFAWKITDGDGFVRQGKNAGKPHSDKPGYGGHWIINFASSFAPQCVVETSPGNFAEITDQSWIKPGYYARIGGSVSSNDSVQTPGLYMNLEKIELKGEGDVISRGITAAEAFGGAQSAYVPEGMRAISPATLAGAPSGVGSVAGAAPFAPGAPAAPGAPVAQPPAQWGGLTPQPAPAAPVASPPPPSTPIMTPTATATYEQYKANGWTDEQLVQHGFMIAAPVAPPPGFTPPAPNTGAPGLTMGAPVSPGFTGTPTPQPQPAPPFAGNAGSVGAPANMGGFAPPATLPTPSPSSSFMGGIPVMLPAAAGVTYEEYRAKGWTDEQLVQHGFMAAR